MAKQAIGVDDELFLDSRELFKLKRDRFRLLLWIGTMLHDTPFCIVSCIYIYVYMLYHCIMLYCIILYYIILYYIILYYIILYYIILYYIILYYIILYCIFVVIYIYKVREGEHLGALMDSGMDSLTAVSFRPILWRMILFRVNCSISSSVFILYIYIVYIVNIYYIYVFFPYIDQHIYMYIYIDIG